MGQQVVCRIHADGAAESLQFTWSVGGSSFPSYALRAEKVKAFGDNAQAARDRLFRLVELHQPAEPKRVRAEIRRTCFELAEAGRSLYDLIFDATVADAAQVKAWLRGLTADGEVDSLEVVTEGRPWFAPWNVVYDERPDEDAFLDGDHDAFAPFWGLRYNLCGGQPVDPLRRKGLPDPPATLIVIDPDVRDDLAAHVTIPWISLRDQLLQFAAGCEAAGGKIVTTRAGLRKALNGWRPQLIYWIGHAAPEYLQLDEPVTHTELGNYLRASVPDDAPPPVGGLVFLNACQTAEATRGVESFLRTFQNNGFSGIVATEERTLDNLACPLGLDALAGFLDRREPIGAVMRDVRERYAPLGLLYGTYCPPDLRVRPAGRANRSRTVERATIAATPAEILSATTSPRTAPPIVADPPLPDEPYLPLATYGPEHRALFAGRDDDVERFALLLGRGDTRLVVLHGESGVGKSSFLRAGLIPYLEDEAVGYRFLRESAGQATDSPALFIRATDDPAGQLAQKLCDYVARPFRFTTPAGQSREVDLAATLADALGTPGPVGIAALRSALLDDPTALDRVLARLSAVLPFTPVLVIDQAEEIFTLARPDTTADRDRALRMLAHLADGRADYKVIVSLRTEFYGRLIGALRRGPAATHTVRDYLLTDLDRDALIDVITRPTLAAPIPHAREIPSEKYRFRYADDVPGQIADQLLRAGRRDGLLPLAQIGCDQLWNHVRTRQGADRIVTTADLAQLGGFEGAISRHVDQQIAAIFPDEPSAPSPTPTPDFDEAIARRVDDRIAALIAGKRRGRDVFRELLTDLTLSQSDGTLSTALLAEHDLRARYAGRTDLPFDTLLDRACLARLLRLTTQRSDDGAEERLVSLGHDALAKVAYPWKQERERRRQLRRVQAGAAVVGAVAVVFALLALGLRTQGRQLEAANAWLAESKNKADASAKQAVKAKEEADRLRKEAEAQTLLAQQRLYDANMQQAQAAWDAGLIGRFEDLLAASKPRDADQQDLRGFEWFYWDKLAHHRLSILKGHAGAVTTVAFSPDGRRLASAGDDGTVRLWDAATGQEAMALKGHHGDVDDVAFGPDGARLASAGRDGTVRLWDAPRNHPERLDPPRPTGGR